MLDEASSDKHHLDRLNMLVDTADTLAILNVEEDESIVSVASTPGVLDLPVVGCTLVATLKAACLGLGARVPPLGDLAFNSGRGRRRSGRVGRSISTILVADDDNCVVQTVIAVRSLDDSTLVVLESLARGVDGDGLRAFLNCCLHAINAISRLHFIVVRGLGHHVGIIVGTKLFLAFVVTLVDRDYTVIFHEIVRLLHPGASASTTIVKLSEEFLVSRVLLFNPIGDTVSTVQQVLLGEVGSEITSDIDFVGSLGSG